MKKAALLFLLTVPVSQALATIETIPASQLEERDGVYYQVYENHPYTGRVVGKYYNGKIRLESHYKDGVKHGKETTWYQNGTPRKESNYKEGERHGEWISWDKDQKVLFHRNYDEGRSIY